MIASGVLIIIGLAMMTLGWLGKAGGIIGILLILLGLVLFIMMPKHHAPSPPPPPGVQPPPAPLPRGPRPDIEARDASEV
jgi:hypothetical protein